MLNRAFSRDLSPYSFIRYINNNFVYNLNDEKSIMKHFLFFDRAVIL